MNTGFTLLELLVVLVIIALLTAVVAVRLQGPYQSARLEDALQRIEFTDTQTRAHARASSTSCQIVWEMDRGLLYSQEREGETARHFEFKLPGSLKIRRLLSAQFDAGSGTVRIEVSPRGVAPTYAVCVGARDNSHRWVLFSGLTGRPAIAKDESHVRQILETLQAPRTDPD